MASERPEAAYAARLLERQVALQAEANRLVEQLAPPELRGYGRYYFVAHHETDAGDEWKIDVSLWSPESPPGPLAHPQELRRRLTPETRLAILWIKDVWHQVPSYPDQVSAMDIYDAVLEHGVRTPEQFGSYLRRRRLPTA